MPPHVLETWSLSDLAEVMATPESNLSKKAMFWIHRGVLQRSPCGSFLSVVDDLKDDGDGHARYVNFVDDVVETAVSVHAQKEESLKVRRRRILTQPQSQPQHLSTPLFLFVIPWFSSLSFFVLFVLFVLFVFYFVFDFFLFCDCIWRCCCGR